MIKTASDTISDKAIFYCLIILFCMSNINQSSAQILTTGVLPQDRICGKWMSEEKNCIVQVYKNGYKYGAKLIWFDDSEDKTKPMDTWVDYKNPNPSLRKRKLIGMEVVDNLDYNTQTNSWENGMIYDAKNGRTWSSAVSLSREGLMKVTGYWKFKFIGKSMNFKRI